jgi:methyl-accepting chemotaxis protein
MGSLWDALIQQAPAFAALCFLIILAGKHLSTRDRQLQKITENYMTAMRDYMVQVRELSQTCHSSHREVSETVANRIAELANNASSVMQRNTESLDKLRESQQQTSIVMAELSVLIRARNGSRKT